MKKYTSPVLEAMAYEPEARLANDLTTSGDIWNDTVPEDQ